MRSLSVTMTACAAFVLMGAGCENGEQVEFCPTDPVLGWPDLKVTDATALKDRYALLVKEPTKGLFPAAVAVARVKAIYYGDTPHATKLEMNTEPEAELLHWNSTLDDQRVVSGVFPIKPIAIQGEEVTVGRLLVTAEALNASLCLIYGTADLAPNESEVRGVLFDTRQQRPLAALYARARIDDLDEALADLPAPPPKDPRYFHAAKDPRYQNAPAMATYKFETLVRDCVIALRNKDTPLQDLPTEGWVPQWPPDALLWPLRTNQPQP